MKIPSIHEAKSYAGALELGFLKGAVLGSVVSVGCAAVLKRKAPSFFMYPGGYHRALLYAAPPMFFSITNMERESRRFESHQRGERHGHDLIASIDTPSSSEKTSFLSKYKYQTIVAGWAASLYGSYRIINKNPYISKTNKLVQARVAAQVLTVAMLVASVYASYNAITPEEATELKRILHSKSWEENLPFVSKANNASH